MNDGYQKIIALLGPTNTGKTHVAIEKMLEFETGIFGLPLRLLAREVYDKCIDKVGASKVALITGEEKIIPSTANYFICTVESMPKNKQVDFIAIDEIQMCADRERGHIFTERMLESRGTKLTMFLGSQVMENIIKELVQKTNLSKTKIEHWFRKDNCFSYPSIEDWNIIKPFLKELKFDKELTYQIEKDWKE